MAHLPGHQGQSQPSQQMNALLETTEGEGREQIWDLNSSQKTVMESSYYRGPAAVREQMCFSFSSYSPGIIFKIAAC